MNKYQKLAGNTIIFAIGNFGAKFLSFILMRLYTGCMTDEQYGMADLLIQTVNVLYPIVTLSMADAVIRFGMEKKTDGRQVYTAALCSTLMGLGVLTLAMPLFNLFDMYNQYSFILYVCCYCSCFRQIASNFVRAKGYVKLFALDGIASSLTIVIFNVLFLVCFNMGVTGYVLSIILSDGLSFVGLTVMAGLHKYLDISFFNKKLFRDMLKYSAPLIPAYVLWRITSASDRWFVKSLCGGGVNGVYSVAYKIPSLLMMFTTLFYQAWQMSAIENRNDSGLSKFYTKIYGAYSSLLMIAAAGIIMLVKPLTYLLVDNDPEKNFIYAYHYTPILVIAMIFQCLCQFTSSVYNVKKKSMNSMLTSIIAAAANLILNFLLIPEYGAYGAAIATAVSYAACFSIRIFDVTRLIEFRAYHIRNVVNTVMVCGMAYIAITEPKLTYLWLILIFLLVTALNFGAVLSTAKKILNRRTSKTSPAE